MFQKVYYCLIREAMIGYHLLPTKYQNCTPHQYYKTGNSAEISCESRKDQSDLEIEKDPYPWLDLDDPRRDVTDELILEKFIDLSDSDLSSSEKDTLLKLVKQYKEAFSLRDKIGKRPNIKIDIDVVDDSPFFVRPFPIHEEDKPLMDRYISKLVSL